MATILERLQTAPPPKPNAKRTLLPDAPPLQQLNLHPVQYLTLAIDSVAPLLRIRSQKGAAGGGAALQLPVPLVERQRRSRAMMWILDAVEKKPNKGSGKSTFALRVAEEIIAIVEGRSSVWEKRVAVHKSGMAARSNLMKMQTRARY